MDTLFLVCLSNTIVGSVLAVGGVVAAMVRRPALAHCLWVLVLIKLVTPQLFQWPPRNAPAISVARITEPRESAPIQSEEVSRVETPEEKGPLSPIPLVSPVPPARVRPYDRLGMLAMWTIGWADGVTLAIWFGAATFWWARTARLAWRFERLLEWGELAPIDVQTQTRDLVHRLGLKRSPEIWFVPAPISPMLWALGTRPRLLIPALLWDRLNADQRDALLAHELAHFKRRDHWVRLLEIAVTGLCWWNPLVWWARRGLRDTEEACCDAWVVRVLPGKAKAYASAILETLDYLASVPSQELVGGTGLDSKGQLKHRLVQILSGSTSPVLSRTATAGVLCITIVAMGIGPGAIAPSSYTIMDLGGLGQDGCSARRINAFGQVVGTSVPMRPDVNESVPLGVNAHPFRTVSGRPIKASVDDLATVLEVRRDLDHSTEGTLASTWSANGINNSGQVIVHLAERRPRQRSANHGYVFDGREVFPLDAGLDLEPLAINDAGQVAGVVTITGDRPAGLRMTTGASVDSFAVEIISVRIPPGQMVDLARDNIGHLARLRARNGTNRTRAYDMNALGQVVGSSMTDGRVLHGFRTAPNQPINPNTDDLGNLGGSVSLAVAVNDLGQAVGSSTMPDAYFHAFRTAPNRPINPATDDLGTLGGRSSHALGINNRGDVVGESETTEEETHAFLFTEGRMIDLNRCVELEPGWFLDRAHDINDRGQILVGARYETEPGQLRQQRTFILTPTFGPAPLAMLILGSAVVGSGIVFRSRRSEPR